MFFSLPDEILREHIYPYTYNILNKRLQQQINNFDLEQFMLTDFNLQGYKVPKEYNTQYKKYILFIHIKNFQLRFNTTNKPIIRYKKGYSPMLSTITRHGDLISSGLYLIIK